MKLKQDMQANWEMDPCTSICIDTGGIHNKEFTINTGGKVGTH